ncbi:MAG: alkaline phosphatase family protein [Candidatus Korarchaeota archaeon]
MMGISNYQESNISETNITEGYLTAVELERMVRDLYFPKYSASVLQVISMARALLGTDFEKVYVPPHAVDHVGIVVIDSFPHEYLSSDSFFSSLFSNNGEFISSVFPTVTQSALASIIFEATPSQHGIVGARMYIEKDDKIVDPFLPEEIGEELFFVSPPQDCRFIFPAYLRGSLFSRELSKRTNIEYYSSIIDGLSTLVHMLREQEIALLYIPELDSIVHKYGPNSQEVIVGLELLEHAFLRFKTKLNDSGIIITSDHGQVPVSNALTLSPQVFSKLISISKRQWRSGRVWHFITNFPEEIINTIKAFNGTFVCKDRISKLIGENLKNECETRIGSLLFLPDSEHEIVPPSGKHSKGQHGSLTYSEIMVPLIFWFP